MDNLLFISISTRSIDPSEMSNSQRLVFNKYYKTDEFADGHILDASKSHPEMSILESVSLGYRSQGETRVTVLTGSEKDILVSFAGLSDPFSLKGYHLAGHMINRFDKPYLIKKFLLNGLRVPVVLTDYKNKPWDQKDVDLLSMYSGGSNYTIPLESLGLSLGLLDDYMISSIDSVKESGISRIKLSMEIYSKLKDLI